VLDDARALEASCVTDVRLGVSRLVARPGYARTSVGDQARGHDARAGWPARWVIERKALLVDTEIEAQHDLVVGGVAVDPELDHPGLPLDVLAGALALFVWVALGSLTQAIASGLGDHPTRRLIVGVLLVSGSAFMLWHRDVVATALRARPWLVLPLAAAELGAATVDGLIGGAYVAFSLTSVGVATIVARARTVWLCVALLETGYVAALLVVRSPGSLVDQGLVGATVGVMVSYPVAALLFMWLRGRFTRFIRAVETTLDDIRSGAVAFTPALGRALRREPLALPPAPAARLTPTERRIIEGLAAGKAAKELAYMRGVSLSTVRTHIKNAKRKSGARTLRELAALPSRADWSESADDGR
jgi:DNA-binding CsgD family transcriptional regulator